MLASTVAIQADTIVLAAIEKDLTGDHKPEVLRLVGVGLSIDSLDLTFSIESGGRVVFRTTLAPFTRRIGFDAQRRMTTRTEHRERLNHLARWFFGNGKFKRPSDFEESLRGAAPAHARQIPVVIARDRRRSLLLDSLLALRHSLAEAERRLPNLLLRSASRADSMRAVHTWAEMRKAKVIVFEYSAGGDALTAIAWSPRDRRFYRLLDCC
jgi:hypothetical protein